MIQTFFISDLHFGHENIIKYTNRKFKSVEEMTSHMIAKWNSVVRKIDLVYVVGDVFFNLPKEECSRIMSELNGTKILVRGNHDRNSYQFYLSIGFSAVVEFATLKINKLRVDICHYPFKSSIFLRIKRFLSGKKRHYFKYYVKNKGQWLIHGHTHSKVFVDGKAINVSVEALNYVPVSLQKIQNMVR